MKIRVWSEVDAKASIYFKKIVALCKAENTMPGDLQIIVVDHCLQTFETHVDSLQELGEVCGVILKSSTRLPEAEDFAKSNCKVLQVSKEDLMDPLIAVSTILDNTSPTRQLLLIDHGGYFVPNIKTLLQNEIIGKQLLGVVEVTENGNQKWEKALQQTPLPLISIARSGIKEMEDMQVGVSICDASDALLYGVHAALTSLSNACIVGYGKIGRSIANNCKRRGVSKTVVIEMDPLRAQLARKEGHHVVMANEPAAKAKAYRKAQIIFSATGSRALTMADIPHLRSIDSESKKVLYIATCTSPDDEFGNDFIPTLEALSTNSQAARLDCEKEFKITPYELKDGRQINILNGGKAVNFAMGGTPGYEICQVWAAILYAASKVVSSTIKPSNAVQALTHADEVAIARVTDAVFFAKTNKESLGNIDARLFGGSASNKINPYDASNSLNHN